LVVLAFVALGVARGVAAVTPAGLSSAGAAPVLERPQGSAGSASTGPTASGAPADVGHRSPTYVVRPGDTLWSIARRLQPDGDVRPLVDRLAARNGGASLRVGQRLDLDGVGG
jgi:Tfp pilus assembly protein FimV